MTIHEINSYRLISILDRELKNWKRLKWWTKDLENSETHQRMFHFFKEFILFRRKILSGEEIEKSLCEWVGVDTFDKVYKDVNVPQLTFVLEYEKILKEMTDKAQP
jgi:hypothetical protein